MVKKLKREYALMVGALLFLCFLFPYTGDDWAWGSSIGIERLNNWFDNYSGRYFGNMIVLALTRSNLLKTIVMAFCLSGIVVLVNKLTGESKIGFYVIIICMLFMPVVVLRQAIVWTSGFANYTTSIFLTLIYIYYVNNIYENKMPQYSKKTIPFLLLLGIANTLIVEHLTIYNVVLSIYVIIFTFCKFKKVFIQHLTYFIGTILGTAYMFSNSVYRSVASGKDAYRTIGSEEGIVGKSLKSYFEVIMKEGFLNNVIVNVLLATVCLIIWKQIKEKLTKNQLVLGQLSVWIIVAYAACSFGNCISRIEQLKLLRYAEGGATILYVVALIVFLCIQPRTWNEKVKLLFILGSIGCMIAPLLVVTPIGSRCFFAPYVMFIYLIMELYGIINSDYKKVIDKLTQYCVIISITGFFYLCYIYGVIFISDNKRVEYAREDVADGKTVIQVENLPYAQYVWCSTPTSESVWEERFKLFYDIDENIVIENKRSHLK